MKEKAIQLFEKTTEEQEKLRHKWHEVYASKEFSALVSLRNVCECYIQRLPCEKREITQVVGQPAKIIRNDIFCPSDTGTLVTQADITATYIQVSRLFGKVPSYLENLYEEAIGTSSTSGRPKISIQERMQRAMLACTLYSVAKFEKQYRLGFFPIRTCEEARLHFYKILTGENATPPTSGTKDSFHLALKDDENLHHQISQKLEFLHRAGFFENGGNVEANRGTLPKSLESCAWWCHTLLHWGKWAHW